MAKVGKITRAAYEQQFGPAPIGRKTSAETMAMWEKLKSVTVAEYLLIEPDRGEDAKKLANSWAMKLRKLAEKLHATFKIRCVYHPTEKHVLIWKEPLLGSTSKTA
jgi:hypothetical protein